MEKRPPYFRYAFHNVYNYTTLGGIAAAALLTQNWWLAVAGAGAEALWLLFGPDSKLLQKRVFDKMHEEQLLRDENAERMKILGELPVQDAERARSLERQHAEIKRLCAENQAFTSDLLRDELSKIDQLVDSFIELTAACHKHETYLDAIDFNELTDDIIRYEQVIERSQDEDARELAQKNLSVLTQRREKLSEIRRFVTKAHGQMELIENTFRLLADQIVTMRSPKELGGQLDELIGGVEAVKTTSREAEAFFQSVAQS